MSDWEQFLNEVPWFLQPEHHAVVSEAQPWNRDPVGGTPQLSALLSSATVTAVLVSGKVYELLAWGAPGARRGWLCHPPSHDAPGNQFPQAHQAFWKVCGGIVERFGEPDSWWLNQNEVLTAGATRVDLASVLDGARWLWQDEGLDISIDPEQFYTVAVEANGNLTLANRDNGQLLLFAPDHAFTGVTPLAGWPPYTLYTIDEAPDLTAWIESCAASWRHRG